MKQNPVRKHSTLLKQKLLYRTSKIVGKCTMLHTLKKPDRRWQTVSIQCAPDQTNYSTVPSLNFNNSSTVIKILKIYHVNLQKTKAHRPSSNITASSRRDLWAQNELYIKQIIHQCLCSWTKSKVYYSFILSAYDFVENTFQSFKPKFTMNCIHLLISHNTIKKTVVLLFSLNVSV